MKSNKLVISKDICHFEWPRINKKMEEILISQLHKSISIYNRSGIFEEFEDNFAKYHNNTKYALLSNSGTSAIFSMFEGLSLSPEDEIICPVYTFFATISPVVYTGAKIVFCDSKSDGNIDPEEIKKKITSKTKAIIVTHMWGMPCDMNEIVKIAKDNNIYLLEDCSHAHGAEYKNQKVGTFGDAAAWSLQGQKIITGGEGGILLTNNKKIYERALLQGHYNKRCKDDIDKDSDFFEYAITGFGLKLRAHPLAISMANYQFSFLDKWLEVKNKYAKRFILELSKYPFLKQPLHKNKKPSLYAYVMQFEEEFSNGVSIDDFVKALNLLGLKEVDRPNSTRPLDKFSLFTKTQNALNRLYETPAYDKNEGFPIAYNFYINAIKIPMWAYEDEEWIVDAYLKGFNKVCKIVLNNPKEIMNIGGGNDK